MFIVNDGGNNSWYKLMSLGSTLSHKIQEDQSELFRLMQNQASEYQENNDAETKTVPVIKSKAKNVPETKSKAKTDVSVKTITEINIRLLKLLKATESLMTTSINIINQVCVDLGIDATTEPIQSTLKKLSDGTEALKFIYEKLEEKKELNEQQIMKVLQILEKMINSLNSINLEVK
jgi:hypothetical protein